MSKYIAKTNFYVGHIKEEIKAGQEYDGPDAKDLLAQGLIECKRTKSEIAADKVAALKADADKLVASLHEAEAELKAAQEEEGVEAPKKQNGKKHKED